MPQQTGPVSAAPSSWSDTGEPVGPVELGSSVLRAGRGQHAFEGCVEQLATAIRLGVYPRGGTLPPERELAERMGVSRTTLREAIAALRAAGFVSTRRGRGGGTVVDYRPCKPSARGARALVDRHDQLRDVLVFRRLVEPGAAYLAATRDLGAADRELLVEAHRTVASATDPAEHRQADSRFHLAVAAVTRSPLTVRSVTEVQSALHDMLSAIPVLPVNIEHSDRQHQQLLRAVLAGDATRARRVMEHHCDDTAALLRGMLT